MPAKDKYHDTVVRALEKAADEQILLVIDNRHLWIDLQATKESDDRIILVEVKGFENVPSPITYLQNVIGQYILYRIALEYLQLDYTLYLAVPHLAYENILQEEISKQAITKLNIKLLVFDSDTEVIVSWQN